MKTITLTQAHKILQNCSAVMFDGNEGPIITSPKLSGESGEGELTGENKHLFLALDWEESGLMYEHNFLEGTNRSVAIQGSSIWLINEEGDEVQLTVLVPANLEV